MAKLKLNEKQLKVGQRELDGAYNASQQKKKNARRMIESGSGKFKAGAKKIFEAESQGQKEIEELCKIFDTALKKIIASLKRSESAVKKGKINATGKEYLMRLIKDFEGLIK